MSEINRLRRRMVNLSGPGYYSPSTPDPVAEWDRRRQYLAEELLKLAVEDSPRAARELTAAMVHFKALAAAALAAAEVIYPEVQEPPLVTALDADVVRIPAAAQTGAAAVMPTTVTPTGD